MVSGCDSRFKVMFHTKPFVLLGAFFFAGVVSSSELNDAFKGRNVNKTIAKVEAILARNPALPRLTRGEILALFENITKADAAKTKQLDPLKSVIPDQPKPEKEKSIMVVLPYNANSTQNEDLEELYTRRPVTRIIGVDYTTPTTTSTTTTTTSTTTARPKRPKKRKHGTRRKPPNQEIRPVYINENTPTSTQSTETFDWKPLRDSESKNPVVKQNNLGFEVPEYMQGTLEEFKNSNNQIFVTFPPPQKLTSKPSVTKAPSEPSTPVPNISIAAQSLTPELKNLLISLGLLNPDGTQATNPVTTTTHVPPPLIQYISINPTVDPTSYIVFKPLPVDTRGNHRGNNEETLSDDMRHFLARFGLTTDTESFRSQKAIDLGKNQSTTTTTTTEMPSTTTTSTTTTTTVNSSLHDDGHEELKVDLGLPSINTDAFTDDMKDVLSNMGLMKMPKRKSKGVIFNPAMRTAGLLNQSEEKEKVNRLISSIKQLSEAEKNKSLSAEEVAEQLQNITATLANENNDNEDESTLELVEGEGSETSYEGYEPAEEELLKLQNGFVDDDLRDDFPLEMSESDTNNSNNNHLNSDILPDLTSLDDKKTNNQSLRDTFNPPDPLSPEELNHFVENSKNEVKRQQPNKRQQPQNGTDTSTETSTTEAGSVFDLNFDEPKTNSTSESSSSGESSSSSDSAATAAGDSSSDQDDSTPSQDDLIDSFGGENPPPNRPNGLYFLVDWNTFLRVGTDNKTVDLNFSPKVGDPKNFLPITVP